MESGGSGGSGSGGSRGSVWVVIVVVIAVVLFCAVTNQGPFAGKSKPTVTQSQVAPKSSAGGQGSAGAVRPAPRATAPSAPVVPAPAPAKPAPAPAPAKPVKPSGAIDWSEAGQHIGENATVYGTVKSTKYASGSRGQPTFLDIGATYPDSRRVTVLIWSEYRGNFKAAPERMYAGKTVCVTGYVDVYDNGHGPVIQIEVRGPGQIVVVD